MSMPLCVALFISSRMSAICCSGVLRSCSVTCLYEPLHKRLSTWHPADSIQLSEVSPSTKPSTSSLSICLVRLAIDAMCFTASNSPSETRAEAISIRLTPSSNSACAILSFSCAANETPVVCSPSRRVVSIISIILFGFICMLIHPLFVSFYFGFVGKKIIDIVKSIHQTIFLVGIDFKMFAFASRLVGDGLHRKVHFDFRLRVGIDRLEQITQKGFTYHNRQNEIV